MSKDGLILLDKPPHVTSHQVVLEIREILGTKKVGHYGTLDPLATGLLVVAVGKATKLFPFFSKADKVYEGQIRLGYSTDTYDSLGKPTSQERENFPSKQRITSAMKRFEGEIDQAPPPFSAKKYKGTPLYVLARRKEEFELRSNRVIVHFFKLTSYDPPFLHFSVKCSSGTYIRSLAHNLGQDLGCGAHLSHLIRTRNGDFDLNLAYSVKDVRRHVEKGEAEHILLPMEILLPQFPKVILKERGTILAKNGNIIFSEDILRVFPQDKWFLDPSQEQTFRLFSQEGKLLALGKRVPHQVGIHPFLVVDS